MMPLPRFDPDDAPTSTWGGTMIGIPKATKHPDAAWKLIEFFYFSDEGLAARAKQSGILPPLRDYWDQPFLHEPDPLYGGQRTMELYISLADQIPPRYTTWATPLATQALGYVLQQAKSYLNAGKPSEGLRDYVQSQLERAQAYVRRVIEHGTFEEGNADFSG
jgi:ABC-type glycerol-3-phosphate transport system substrate-binding protein